MMSWMWWRVALIRRSTGVPLIGKKRIRWSGGGNTLMALMRSSSVWLVRSLIALSRRQSPGCGACCTPDPGGVLLLVFMGVVL